MRGKGTLIKTRQKVQLVLIFIYQGLHDLMFEKLVDAIIAKTNLGKFSRRLFKQKEEKKEKKKETMKINIYIYIYIYIY